MGNYDIIWTNLEMLDVLDALSNDKAFILYNSIAVGQDHNFKALIRNMGNSPHQHYSRIIRFAKKAGLARRENGKYATTALGNVVYNAISTICIARSLLGLKGYRTI